MIILELRGQQLEREMRSHKVKTGPGNQGASIMEAEVESGFGGEGGEVDGGVRVLGW
jgi:hypothetical protein